MNNNKGLEALERIGTNAIVLDKFSNDLGIIEKELNNYYWLLSKLDIDFLNRLPTVEDKLKLMEIMGVKYE